MVPIFDPLARRSGGPPGFSPRDPFVNSPQPEIRDELTARDLPVQQADLVASIRVGSPNSQDQFMLASHHLYLPKLDADGMLTYNAAIREITAIHYD